MKSICADCGWQGDHRLTLVAEHPFQPGLVIKGCPHCLEVMTMRTACDFPGCWRVATCGSPVGGRYRYTCGEHAP